MSSLVPGRMSSGKVIWYVYYRDGRGVKRGISTRTPIKKDALRIQAEIDKQLLGKRFNLDQPISVSKLFEKRLQYLADQNRAEETIARESKVFRAFLKYLDSDPMGTPPDEVFEGYKKQRRSNGVSVAGINLELRHLKATFRWGSERRYCHVPKIQMLKAPVRLVKPLSDDEVKRFLAAAEEHWKLIFETYLLTGGRKDEVANLTWRDIDFDRSVIVFRKTKSGKEREVPLHRSIAGRIAALPRDREPVWGFKSDHIYRQCLKSMDRAGITDPEKRGLHVLRHTFATNLIRKGVPLAIVSRLLGHSTIKITVDLYFHLADKEKAEAINKLEV